MRIVIPGNGKSWCGKIVNWAPNKSPMVAFGRRVRGCTNTVEIAVDAGDILWGGCKPADGAPYTKQYWQVDPAGFPMLLQGGVLSAFGLYKGTRDPALYPKFSGGKRKRGGGGNGYAPTPAPVPVPAPAPAPVPIPSPAICAEVGRELVAVLRALLICEGELKGVLEERVEAVFSMAEKLGWISE